MKENSSKVKVTTNDLHLKNIFLNDYYLELGNIDIDVMIKILKYNVVPVKEISYFPIQNKGIGAFKCENKKLRDELPFMFFKIINGKDRAKQLYLTYGLLECYKPNFKDRFMPVFLLPIDLYYEDNEFLIQLSGKPFENPLIYTIFGEQNRLNFIQNKNLNNIYVLDQSLIALNKMSNFDVKLECYLTFATKKKRNLIENEKIFKQVKLNDNFYLTKVHGKEEFYMSTTYTKQQRIFLSKAFQKDNLTLSGRDGTGKTTVLKDIAINAISRGGRVLYISNKKETSNDVLKTFTNLGLKNIVADFTSSFTSLNNYDNKFEQLQDIDYSDKLEKLHENYKLIEDYEQIMGGRIVDFLFKEILEQLSVLIDIDHSNKDFLPAEDLEKLDYVHKNEFIIIKSALEKIQSNLYRLKSFKDNVWKEIPISNSIKYANQVLSLIRNMHQGYSALYENRKRLENEYGFKTIENFANFKKVVHIIEKVSKKDIPLKWQQSYEVFKEASDSYNNLKKDLYLIQEYEYILNTNYIDPFAIDIKREINLVLDNHFTLDEKESINNIFEDSTELKSVIEQTLYDLKEYSDKKTVLTREMGYDFTKTDEDVQELMRFIDVLADNVITIRVSNAILNNRCKEVISNIEKVKSIYEKAFTELEAIIKDYPNIANDNIKELKKLLKEDPNKIKLIRKRYGRLNHTEILSLFDRYIELNKTIKKVDEEYYVITGFKMGDGVDSISLFKTLDNYYSGIKDKPFYQSIRKFIDGFDSRIKNNKKEGTIKNLYSIKKIYNSLQDSFSTFVNYRLMNKDSGFTEKLAKVNAVIDYLQVVFKSNNRVMSKLKNNDSYFVKIDDYLELDNVIDKYNKYLSILKGNKKYSDIYCDLYEEEKTNINLVAKEIQIYSDYNNLFNNDEKLIESFSKLNKLKQISSDSENELNNINETLKIYTRIFKDGVARYYYNDFASILEYLNTLQRSKDELVAYLNVTSGMATLYSYGLNGLVEYIINNDKNDNIVNDFQVVYFSRLKDRYLYDQELKYDDEGFINLLDKTIQLEEEVRLIVNNNVIKSICESEIKKSHNHEVSKRNYQKFINKNTIKSLVIANTSILEENFSVNKFDLIIIDDAELLNAIEYNAALKGKQIIIAGSYIIHKAFTNSLLSIYFDEKTTVFKERFIPTPKKLLDKAAKINGLIQNNIHSNNGVEVINDNVEEYIYSLYNENSEVLINYFMKDIEKQKKFIESVAITFLKSGVKDIDIMNFFNKNISVVDLISGQLGHSDYNILDLSEYLYIDSEIESSNAFDRLLLAKEKLIIYDKNDDLSKDMKADKLLFYTNVKKIANQKSDEKLYNFEILDENLAIIISALREKGYTVYPSNSQCDLIVARNDKFVGVNILFSNNSFSEVINNYRDSSFEYKKYGWDIIYINLIACSNGLTYVINSIINKLEKKEKKKGKK